MGGLDHPFFLPVWRRVLTVALSGGWGLVELWSGNTFWAMLFLAAGVFAFWRLFITKDPDRHGG